MDTGLELEESGCSMKAADKLRLRTPNVLGENVTFMNPVALLLAIAKQASFYFPLLIYQECCIQVLITFNGSSFLFYHFYVQCAIRWLCGFGPILVLPFLIPSFV